MATLKTMTALESSTLLSTWMSEINIHKENILLNSKKEFYKTTISRTNIYKRITI